MMQVLKNKKVIFGLVILLLLIIIPVTLMQLGQSQESRSGAAGEAIAVRLDPNVSSQGIAVGDTLEVKVYITGGQNDITAVDIAFSYSEATLDNPIFTPTQSLTTITNTALPGSLRYVGVNPTSNSLQTGAASGFLLGTLTFNAKAQGTATIGFSNIHINAAGVAQALPIDTTNTIPGSYTITAAATGTSTTSQNLALNKPVTVSSEYSTPQFQKSNAVDSDIRSYWSSAFSDPQWIYVDLGAIYNISRIVLVWENAYAKSFKLQVSTDSATWTDVYSTTTSTGGTQDLNVTAQGRYVRMYGTERGIGFGYALFDFQIYGAQVSASPSPTTSGAVSPTSPVILSPTPTPVVVFVSGSKAFFDFNDDGKVDEIDLNILYSSFRSRQGD